MSDKRETDYKRVIIFALDGVGLFFDKVPTPNLDAFISEGISSKKAKAVIPTDSAQNWGSVLHGVYPDKHGLKNSDIESGAPYDENSKYPSIYKILSNSEKNIKMASYAAWSPINTGIIELSVKADLYSPLTHENIFLRCWLRFKHHCLKNSIYDHFVVSRLAEYINDPENKEVKLLFIHLTDVDEHGHDHGFDSQEYLEQIKVMDSQIGDILKIIDNAKWKDDSFIMMTTDHGGIGKSHGGSSDEEVNVFLAVCGNDIQPGSEIKSEVTNMDCAALALRALGEDIPENFDAKIPLEFGAKFADDDL